MARIKLDKIGISGSQRGSYTYKGIVHSIPDYQKELVRNYQEKTDRRVKETAGLLDFAEGGYGTCRIYTPSSKPKERHAYVAHRETGNKDVDLYIAAYEEARVADEFGFLKTISRRMKKQRQVEIDLGAIASAEVRAGVVAIDTLYAEGRSTETIEAIAGELKRLYVDRIGEQLDSIINLFKQIKTPNYFSLNELLQPLAKELSEKKAEIRKQFYGEDKPIDFSGLKFEPIETPKHLLLQPQPSGKEPDESKGKSIEPSELIRYCSDVLNRYLEVLSSKVKEELSGVDLERLNRSMTREFKPNKDQFLKKLKQAMQDFNEVSQECFTKALEYYKAARAEPETTEPTGETLEDRTVKEEPKEEEPAPGPAPLAPSRPLVSLSEVRIRTTTHFYKGKPFRTERRTVKVDFLPDEPGKNVDFVVY